MRLSAAPTRFALLRLTAFAAAAVALIAATTPAHAQAKQPIRGLVTMGRLAFVTNPSLLPDNSLREANTHPGIYAGAVVLVTWQQLEPTPGHYDFSAIEAGLDAVRAYNRRYPRTPLLAKLRVFGGPNAPAWAMQLDGGPITLHEHNTAIDVGHFWSAPYRRAWHHLQDQLAARYDTDPLLGEVAISSCASSTAEPFVVPLNTDNVGPLIQAGYTDAGMQACLTGAIDDYDAWHATPLDYTFNPWRTVATGHARPAPGFTESVIEAFRARLGARAVIANHGLTPELNPFARTVLQDMQRLGAPIEFQTRSPNQDWDATVQTGESLGVTELEIWDTRDAGGPAPVTIEQLRRWRSDLAR